MMKAQNICGDNVEGRCASWHGLAQPRIRRITHLASAARTSPRGRRYRPSGAGSTAARLATRHDTDDFYRPRVAMESRSSTEP
jgi:hypothetical protein